MGPFQVHQPLPGVWHIQDALGVCFTLLAGDQRALLLDTGYGLHDPRPLIRSLTDKPLTVVCSHGHFDHALGARFFDRVFVAENELDCCRVYTCRAQRERTLARAEALGVAVPDARAYLDTEPLARFSPLPADTFDLGGLTARVLLTPGHTAGSISLWIEERGLLLPGDNQNPTTWVFFPECAPVREYAAMMRRLADVPFTCALTPHYASLVPGGELRTYIAGLTEAAFAAAKPVSIPPYERIRTRECAPYGEYRLVFDGAKYGSACN